MADPGRCRRLVHPRLLPLFSIATLAIVFGATGLGVDTARAKVRAGAAGPSVEWTRQFGTDTRDDARAVAVDGSGNVYVAGVTLGALPGQRRRGAIDAYVRKYGAQGVQKWTRQFGTSAIDEANGIAVDATGNVYVVGSTLGTFPGQSRTTQQDSFVRKFSRNGRALWTRQFHWRHHGQAAAAVAIDPNGDVLVVGHVESVDQAYVRRLGSDGALIWNRRFAPAGPPEPYADAAGVAMDRDGNAYVVGKAVGSFPGESAGGGIDAYVRKYSRAGGVVWTRQFGVVQSGSALSVTAALAIATDNTDAMYVVGQTNRALPGQSNAGSNDAFVRKYESDGVGQWTHQYGGSGADQATGVTIRGAGDLYVFGQTTGVLPGQTHLGGLDAHLRRISPSTGQEVWTSQFGTTKNDLARGVAAAGATRVYVVGRTSGKLPGQVNLRADDAYLRKFTTD